MQDFNNQPVNYIIKNDGVIIDITNEKKYGDSEEKVVHIVADEINNKVVKAVESLIAEHKISQLVVNRTKLIYSDLEFNNLSRITKLLKEADDEITKNTELEFTESKSSYSLKEVRDVNNRLKKEAKVIKSGYVIYQNGKSRQFSPVEKLFAIHSIVTNNLYKANDDISGDATRNLYSVLQKDREGIVCLGYAKWFQALADLVDPQKSNFSVSMVASFFPKERKENYDYKKISSSGVYRNVYSEEERLFHATNMIMVNDKIYGVKGVFHNDSTFDCITDDDKSLSYLHFMWPFQGYMKEKSTFIPLHLFHNYHDQAENLSSLVLVNDSKLKISPQYMSLLKYPVKPVYLKQKERVFKLLSTQIKHSKRKNLFSGKEFSIKNNPNIFEKHNYKDWESAIKIYIKDNNSHYPDNKKLLKYIAKGGILPNIADMKIKDVLEINNIIMNNDYEEAKKLILQKYDTKDVDVVDMSRELLMLIRNLRADRSIASLHSLQRKYDIPDIGDLYKADVEKILHDLTMYDESLADVKIHKYLETNQREEYKQGVEQIIEDGEINIEDIKKVDAEIERSIFEEIVQTGKTEEIYFDTMQRIKDNVYEYFQKLSAAKLRNADIDLERFEEI